MSIPQWFTEYCGNCKFHRKYTRDADWTCYCEDSDYYGLITDYEDTCDEFEERNYEYHTRRE